jgi:hypothetical protein
LPQSEHDDGVEEEEPLETPLGAFSHVPLPPTERFVLCCRFGLFLMLLIFLGDFLLLPSVFLMIPGGVTVVGEDDGCCPSSLAERDGNFSSGALALSRQYGSLWRSVDCKVEDDGYDYGGHTHGDLPVLVPVPPNSDVVDILDILDILETF